MPTTHDHRNPDWPREGTILALGLLAADAERMAAGMLRVIAQWERETIVERITDAMVVKRRRAERVSMFAPPDWRFDSGRPVEDTAVRHAQSMNADGHSLREIANALNAARHRAQLGRPDHQVSVNCLTDALIVEVAA